MASSLNCDIAVVGGGVIGLACAWRLAQGGAKVALFERSTCGREASWAAAGMLAPLVEAARHPLQNLAARAAMLDLCSKSRDLYPEFAQQLPENIELRLGDVKGDPDDWRKAGILYVATRPDDTALSTLQEFEESEEAPPFSGFPTVWLPKQGQVNNQKLVEALQNAAVQAGVAIHSFQPVSIRSFSADGIEISTPSHSSVRCAKLLLCAGAWSGGIEGLNAQWNLPVRPISGQMLALHPRQAKLKAFVSQIVYSSDVYLVPRLNNQLLVGATMADIGFDKSVRVESMTRLLQSAARLMPAIEDWEIVSQWAGLRPASPDGLPIMGRTPQENVFVATGHFRNGILLTPITAQLMADCILNDKEPPREFSMARFN